MPPRPRSTTTLRFSQFRGMNTNDPPRELKPGVGTLCRNFYFDGASLKPRKGFTVWASSGVSVTGRGFYATRIDGSDYLFSFDTAVNGATVTARRWQGGAANTLTVDNNSGNANVPYDVNFVRFNDLVIAGNAMWTQYYKASANAWRTLGMETNGGITSATAGAAGVLTGTYRYYVTSLDPTSGAEGPPSAASSKVTVTAKQIDILGITAGSDYKKRLYRVGGTITTPKLVAEIAAGTTSYTDNKADDDLGAEMTTGNDQMPGLRFFAVWKGRLIGAFSEDAVKGTDRSTLFISYYNEPWRCPTVTDLEDPNDGARIKVGGQRNTRITGLRVFGDVVLIFTAHEAFILSGDSPQNFTLTRAWRIGCTAHRTIQQVGGWLVWQNQRGVYAWNGAGPPVEISRPIKKTLDLWVADERQKASAFSYHGRYYLVGSDEVYFCDFRRSDPDEPHWAWGEITGWGSPLQMIVLGEDGSTGMQVYGYYGTGATHRVTQHESGDTDHTSLISVRWDSPLAPGEELGEDRKWRVRRLRMFLEGYAANNDSANDSPSGAATALTANIYRNSRATVSETHTIDPKAADSGETYVQYDQDCAIETEGAFFQVSVTGELWSNSNDPSAPRSHPIIHNIELMLVALR